MEITHATNKATWHARYLSVGSLTRNGLFALGQSLAVTIFLLLAYRLVINYAGLERFGVWSLLIAGSAIARIGDISGGGALARFVAMAGSEEGGLRRSRNLVHTVILTSFAVNIVIGLIVWVSAPYVIPLFIAPPYLPEARALVPYVVVSLVLSALGTAVASGIDGAQRADQRALVVSVASLLFFIACVLLVPSHGVIGFGAAQIVQQGAMLILGWVVLRRHIPGLGWLPYHWQREPFAETTSYAVKLNAIGVVGLMFEPAAKFAFNYSGGPSLVALYELASRFVIQLRALVIAAATPLVPVFAAQANPKDPVFRSTLVKATRVAALAAVSATLAILAGTPVMSVIVLGQISADLIALTTALTAGWSVNVIVVPIYFAAQAIGVLRWNFLSHLLIAFFVLFGAFVLVPNFGSFGLVLAIITGLFGGMLVVLFGNARALQITDLARELNWPIICASIAIVILCLAVGFLTTHLVG